MARKKRVRLQDIAEKTGFSIATISHFINKTRHIDESTKEIIMKATQELGYQGPSKRHHFSKSTCIGVVIADIRVDFFDELIRELENIAYDEGFHLLVMDSEENPEKELHCIKTLIKANVVGLIVAPCDTQADFSFCKDIPLVQVDRKIDSDMFDFIGIDNMMAAYYLTKRLIEKGKPSIGMISFADKNYCARERKQGYRLAMKENNIFKPEHILEVEYDGDTIHSNITKFISENQDIDTIICTSSNICYEVLGQISRLGENNHIKFISTFDNNKWLDHVAYPVDAIAQPITNIALTAIELLQNKIAHDQTINTSRKIILNFSLEGRSTLFKEEIHKGPLGENLF